MHVAGIQQHGKQPFQLGFQLIRGVREIDLVGSIQGGIKLVMPTRLRRVASDFCEQAATPAAPSGLAAPSSVFVSSFSSAAVFIRQPRAASRRYRRRGRGLFLLLLPTVTPHRSPLHSNPSPNFPSSLTKPGQPARRDRVFGWIRGPQANPRWNPAIGSGNGPHRERAAVKHDKRLQRLKGE
jgi:hypothetical protein